MTGRGLSSDMLAGQRGHLFPWLPVCLGAGIGTYFALPAEPGPALWAVAAAAVAGALALAWRHRTAAPLWIALAAVLAGLCLGGARTWMVAAPVLDFRYYGPVEGRVVAVDRSASDAVRLTLDRVVLARTAAERTPARVRVSLHGTQGFLDPAPGMTVILTAHLSPPAGPVEPGGFDFRRQAWFQGLGAVGYTRTPALMLEPAPGGLALAVHRLRDRISRHVRTAMPGPEGAFAAAIMTGDRSAIDLGTLEGLRAANLAHLLAISGLHMGLLTGFVFAALRLFLAAVPRAALRLPAKKIAAIAALVAGAGYLALSGGNVATERAFVMVAIVLFAVLLNRRALTLRAVAVAALVVLLLQPEALTGPGFQMSFAATTALIVVFGGLRDNDGRRLPKVLRPAAALLISSAVAGAATAPIAAAHFNQIPHYGLIANLAAVPLMGLVIVPMAVLAALLAPFGLDWVAYGVMAPAISWILWVAATVSAWDGALSFVPAPGGAVLPLVAFGGLWAALWQGWGRAAALAPAALALWLWSGAERPPILIADTGRLMGVMDGEGRALTKARGDGFSAATWLENDGDPVTQEAAAERPGIEGAKGVQWATLGLSRIVLVSGRDAAGTVADWCGRAEVVITAARLPGSKDCLLFDETALRRSGAVAVYPVPDGLRIETAAEKAGARPWSGPARMSPKADQ